MKVIFSRLSDRNIALGLSLIVLVVYGLTMCRTIYTGDDGDFETAMATGGICHPTGYPLFTLLGRLFLILLAPFFAEPAARINFMTALFGASAVGLFYRFVSALHVPRSLAAMTSLILAFAPTLWQQSLSCEVYSLTCLFLCTALWLSARLAQGEQRVLVPLALVYGFALTNNLTMALFFPGFLALALWRVGWRGLLRPSMIACFLLPLALYAYLPLAAKYGSSPVRWGSPITPELFWKHVSGDYYRQFMFSIPIETTLVNLKQYAQALVAEFGWWILWLAPIGIQALWRQGQKALVLLMVWVFLSSVFYAINYNILDIYVYYLPSFVVVAAWLGVGAVSLLRKVLVKPVIVSLMALGLPLAALGTHWQAADKSGNYLEADFAENVLKSAPEGALIVSDSSLTFTLWYQKWVKHQRPDVVVIDWNTLGSALLYDAWYYRHLKEQYPPLDLITTGAVLSIDQFADGSFQKGLFTQALNEGKAVLMVRDRRFTKRRVLNTSLADVIRGFDCLPWGITERLYLPGTAPSSEQLLLQNKGLWPRFQTRGLLTGWGERDQLQRHLFLRYAESLQAFDALAKSAGHPELTAELEKQLGAS